MTWFLAFLSKLILAVLCAIFSPLLLFPIPPREPSGKPPTKAELELAGEDAMYTSLGMHR